MNKIELLTRDLVNSFKRLKLLTTVCVSCSLLFSFLVVVVSSRRVDSASEKIYVLEGGSISAARRMDEKEFRTLEIEDHVARFHELLFTISPQREGIERNLERAFNLADHSAYEYTQDLREKGFYTRIISGNISQSMVVDSVRISGSGYPYQVKTYGKRYIIREKSISQYLLVSSCQVMEAVRSSVNPHGLLVERFRVEENSLLGTRNR